MNKVFQAILIVMIATLSMLSTTEAATPNGRHTVYLDSAGNIIGERILFCNNYMASGGTLSSPYQLTLTLGCGYQDVNCGPDGNTEYPWDLFCSYHNTSSNNSFTVSMTAALRNTGLTKSELCLAYFYNDCDKLIFDVWAGGPYGILPN